MAVDLKSSGAEALPQIPGSVDVDATAAGTEAERLGTAIENTQGAGSGERRGGEEGRFRGAADH